MGVAADSQFGPEWGGGGGGVNFIKWMELNRRAFHGACSFVAVATKCVEEEQTNQRGGSRWSKYMQ